MSGSNQERALGLDNLGPENAGTSHEGTQLVDSLMKKIQEIMNDPHLRMEVRSRLQGMGFQSPLQREGDPVSTLNEGSKRGFHSKEEKQAKCGEPSQQPSRRAKSAAIKEERSYTKDSCGK